MVPGADLNSDKMNNSTRQQPQRQQEKSVQNGAFDFRLTPADAESRKLSV